MNPNNRGKAIKEVDKEQVHSSCCLNPLNKILTSCIIKKITIIQDLFLLAVQSSGPLESNMSAAESERERVRRLERLQEIDDVAPHLKALKRLTDAKLFPPI